MKVHGNIRVIIADDHEIFRDGLKLMLQRQPDIELIAEAEDGKELIEKVEALQPDVVITDVKMPRMDGASATKFLTEKYPDIGIIALTMFDEEEQIIEMLESGAKGYLLKNADKNEIREAIQSVYEQMPYYCKHTSHRLAQLVAKSKFNPYKQKAKLEFSDREKQIITYICEGVTSKEIAENIFLSVRTVEGLRMKIMEKMNAKNTAGIIIYAIKNGHYSPNDLKA
ncbi:response regulator transcription factor [Terrimonas sp. NA20]|uniref:Response regulator transcription factor n=1 Tax=Terrimonas ginsenosidimutans TaxID=2908004 RepID=A0ABS9KNP5_9BACT|nr:response regulator transcription factor [Terrimonas ginsenosidimutans]MCG2613952.1 response regulator transcription factor [Terrimonas ginsenosidimutans]